MAQVFSQAVTLAVGTRTFGPFNVPDGLLMATIRLTNWSQTGRTLAFELHLSPFDDDMNFVPGGVGLWQRFVSMNPTPGGRPVGRDGTTDASVVVGPLPDVPNRQARVITTVAGGTVTTTVSLDVS